jgi:hypothetical protein
MLVAVLAVLRDCIRTRAEVLALRHQLSVLQRSVKRPKPHRSAHLDASEQRRQLEVLRLWRAWPDSAAVVEWLTMRDRVGHRRPKPPMQVPPCLAEHLVLSYHLGGLDPSHDGPCRVRLAAPSFHATICLERVKLPSKAFIPFRVLSVPPTQ